MTMTSKNLSRRQFLVGVAGTAGAALLASCGPAEKPALSPAAQATSAPQSAATKPAAPVPTTASAPVTLSYPNWMLGEAGVGDYWKATVAEFEKQNPGVTLKTTLIPSNQYEDKTLTDMAGGQIPDIYPAFTNQLPRLITEGLLEPLDPWLSKAPWKDKELPVIQIAQRDGKTYGVVLTASPQGMIYNKQLLDRAGVTKIPEDVESFYQAVKQVKQKTGEFGYGFPTLSAEELNAYIVTMQWVLGYGSDWSDKDGKPTANDPKTIEGMTWIKRFLDEDLAPKGMKVLDLRNMFKDGKLAFMFEGPWVLTLVKASNAQIYPYVGFTRPPTPTHASITGGAFFTIPKGSKHKEIAWKYIDMVNQESWQRKWLEENVQLPGQAIKPGEQFLKENPWVNDMVEVAAQYQAGFGYAPPSAKLAVRAAEFRKIVMSHVDEIYAGKVSVKDGCNQIQSELEAFVAKIR